MSRPCAFKVSALPDAIDYRAFASAMSGTGFMLCHNIKSAETWILAEDEQAQRRMESSIKGMRLSAGECALPLSNALVVLPFLYLKEERRRGEEQVQALGDIYGALRGSDSSLMVSFIPDSLEHVRLAKEKVEHALSGKEVRMTRLLAPGSIQAELYYGSDERRVLASMLEMLNGAMLENGLSYKVMVIITNPSESVRHYVESKVLILGTFASKAKNLQELREELRRADAMPFDLNHAALMVNFSERIARKTAIATSFSDNKGEIRLGTYLDGAVFDTGEEVKVSLQTLNLGVILTGLPGTGKSFAAMRLLGQVIGSAKPMTAIIAPTEEWSVFAGREGMEVVRLYEDSRRINFFRCDAGINIERFYENLAMLMASASNAGPYRNSMEKCLLSAFRRVYAETREPDPVEVYDAIEAAVIEKHAKRSNTGVKYTKHGENIMAALESLRLMLFKPQFAYKEGIGIGGLLQKGVVFDLSKVSNNMKPFFYALLLNQVYSFADELDIRGDDTVRMLICVEEAQLIFDASEQSAASLDLGQRIQDFRKKGICLALITHSVTDINVSLRRLCQTKLYFRQSADSVRYAVSDLVFNQEMHDAIADKLKMLEQRVCAASYMTLNNNSKEPAGPIFVRTDEMKLDWTAQSPHSNEVEKQPPTSIQILDGEEHPTEGCRIEIQYVGTLVFSGRTDATGMATMENLLCGKPYKLTIFGDKRRDSIIVTIKGGEKGVFKRH